MVSVGHCVRTTRRSAPSDITGGENLSDETNVAKNDSRKTNGGRTMRPLRRLKTIENQLLSLPHPLESGKTDLPGHLYRLFVQFIALHTWPSPFLSCLSGLRQYHSKCYFASHLQLHCFRLHRPRRCSLRKPVGGAGVSRLPQNDQMNHLCSV